MSTRTKSAEGDMCLVLGFILLFGGFVTFFYEENYGLYHPYRELSIPLLVLGVILIIAGAFIRTYISKKT